MPVMDGMEACKIIMERDPDTIIVFVTAHALDEFKVKAKAAARAAARRSAAVSDAFGSSLSVVSDSPPPALPEKFRTTGARTSLGA